MSVTATCFIVPASFNITLSASTIVVEVALVPPSIIFNSAAVDVTPSKMLSSDAVEVTATSSAITDIVQDTSPQLGGNLDMNGADIVTTSNATIDLDPNGTGTVVV